jgi:hypothetical protein
MNRECDRYDLNREQVDAVVKGDDPVAGQRYIRRWWEVVVVCFAVGVFVWLALGTRSQHIQLNISWMIALILATFVPLGVCGTMLWRRTRFS